MKRYFSTGVVLLFLMGCGNNDAAKNDEAGKAVTAPTASDMDNLKAMSADTDDMNRKTEALKKLTPLSPHQLKALLPEELGGLKRTDDNATDALGYAAAEGRYQKDAATLKLQISDCAGEAGAGMYALAYWGSMNVQQESEQEYTKTVDFNGGKAIENFKKSVNQSSLTYIANDRLLVTLKGRNLAPSALKDLAQTLTLKP